LTGRIELDLVATRFLPPVIPPGKIAEADYCEAGGFGFNARIQTLCPPRALADPPMPGGFFSSK
jgi:hypothetical protein